MIKLICIDVDGTLIGSSNTVHPKIWEAAKVARARGTHLAICTGRPAMADTANYAKELAPESWHIFQGGASIMNFSKGQSESQALPLDALAFLKRTAREKGWVLELYSDEDYVAEQPCDGSPAEHLARSHAQLLGLDYTPRAFDSLKGEVIRAQWVVSDEQYEAAMALPQQNVLYSAATSPSVPGSHFISVTAQGVDKCSAIAALADKLGVSLTETMMVGDGHNDISALKLVGHPVAMGNAHEDLKKVADHVVGHVDEGGLAQAIELAGTL